MHLPPAPAAELLKLYCIRTTLLSSSNSKDGLFDQTYAAIIVIKSSKQELMLRSTVSAVHRLKE